MSMHLEIGNKSIISKLHLNCNHFLNNDTLIIQITAKAQKEQSSMCSESRKTVVQRSDGTFLGRGTTNFDLLGMFCCKLKNNTTLEDFHDPNRRHHRELELHLKR